VVRLSTKAHEAARIERYIRVDSRYARIEAFGVPLCIFVDSYHKEKMAMSDNEMRAAVFSKGDLIEQALPELERRARDVLSAAECRAIDEAHLTG